MSRVKGSKIIAALLTLVMVFGMFPFNMLSAVYAEEVEEVSYTVALMDGENVLTRSGAQVTLTNKEDETKTATAETKEGIAQFGAFIEVGAVYIAEVKGVVGYTAEAQEISFEADVYEATIAMTALETVEISGTITDENNNPLAGITIKIEGAQETETVTDMDGVYVFNAYKGQQVSAIVVSPEDKYDDISINGNYSENIVLNQSFALKTLSVVWTMGENGTFVGTDSVIYGGTYTALVKANENHWIGELKINGEAVAEAVSQAEYTLTLENVTVEQQVEVKFVQATYTVEFEVGAEGEVLVDGQTVGGTVTTTVGNEVSYKAVASEGYHVAEVKHDDAAVFTAEGNEATYEGKITAAAGETKKVSVTFALNTYLVSLEVAENGAASFAGQAATAEVSHNGEAVIRLDPNDGYLVDTLTAEGYTFEIKEDKDGLYATLSGVTADVTVKVSFKAMETVQKQENVLENDYYLINSDKELVQLDENTYVIPTGATVTVAANAENGYIGIKQNSTDADKEFVDKITVEETTKIDNLIVKKSVNDKVCVAVDIKLIVDTNAPELTMNYGEEGWTNEDVTISCTAADVGEAGVAYVVYSTGTLENGTRMDLVDGKYTVTLTEEQNQTYYIYAVDHAGNVSEPKTVTVSIDKTDAVIKGFVFSTEENTLVQDAIHFLTFGIFCKEEMYVTVEAADVISNNVSSGVASITLYAGDEEVETIETEDQATFKLTAEQFANYTALTATVTDKAGNTSDPVAPEGEYVQVSAGKIEGEITTPNAVYTATVDEQEQKWYGTDTTFTVTVQDKVVGLASVKIQRNNDEPEVYTFKDVRQLEKQEYTIETDPEVSGEQTLTVTVINNAGISDTYTKTVYIDRENPEIIGYDFNKVNDDLGAKVINFLTFGIFCNGKIEITVTAQDTNASSGMKEITLSYRNNSETKTVDAEGKATFTVPEKELSGEFEIESLISAKVIDNVAHESEDTIPNNANTTYEGKQVETEFINNLMFENKVAVIEFTLPETAFKNDWYSADTTVGIKVSDVESGLGSATVYLNDKVVGQFETTTDEKTEDWNCEFSTAKGTIGSNNEYVIRVEVTDNAGNTTAAEETIYKDTTLPTISTFKARKAPDYVKNQEETNEEETNEEETNEEEWYNDDVFFDVAVNDETPGLYSVVVKINGDTVRSFSATETEKTEDWNCEFSTADGKIGTNGEYVIEVIVVDNAGNKTDETHTIYKDTKDPTIDSFRFGNDTNAAAGKKFEQTYYGYYFAQETEVVITAKDDTDEAPSAGIKSITYELVNIDGKITTDTVNVDANNAIKVDIPANFKGQIYAKATDNVDNVPDSFVTPDGVIIETQEQHDKAEKEGKDIHITITKEKAPYTTNDGVELYKNDVEVTITVEDKHSGIREIEWSVVAPYDQKNNQSGKVVVNNDKSYKDKIEDVTLDQDWVKVTEEDNLVTKMQKKILVTNNSNDIELSVTMTDRAGNTSNKTIPFSIDKSAPIITVEMNDDDDQDNDGFFNKDRSYKVTILERNFVNENVVFAAKVTSDNKSENPAWTDLVIDHNFALVMDGDKPQVTVLDGIAYYTYVYEGKFVDDGHYAFAVSATDLVKNGTEDSAVSYVKANANENENVKDIREISNLFTIDKTKPRLTVSYDNHDVRNGNYYKAQRTATLTITEHNFDAQRVDISKSFATNDGASVSFPTLTNWYEVGQDTWRATITYAADARYTFDIEFSDMAGNQIAEYAEDVFYVDQTAPSLTISGVADQSANKGEVAPVITYSDVNFDRNAVTITLDGVNNGANLKYSGAFSEIKNGQTYTYENFEQIQKVDDIYTLTVTLTDMAGNETTMTIRFSANRFGSVYDISALADLNGKYLQTEQDIVITEINVDVLDREGIQVKVTKNGTPTDLVEGTDYTVTIEGGDGKWSVYTYTINKSIFASDGRYSVSVASEDAAGNVNENIDETKEAEISFGIDKTKPVVVPIDLESGVQYAVDMKTVTVEIKDNLVLESVKIYLNGQEISYTVDGENYIFDIAKSNSKQTVKIVAVDAAGNEEPVEILEFLVNANIFVRWYNNTPLFVGSIIGFVVLALAIVAFFVFGKKKNK